MSDRPQAPVDIDTLRFRSAARRKRRMDRWSKMKFQTYMNQKGKCFYCRIHINYGNWTREHRQPRSLGGNDRADNVVGACKECNTGKGCMTEAEFLKSEWFKKRMARFAKAVAA